MEPCGAPLINTTQFLIATTNICFFNKNKYITKEIILHKIHKNFDEMLFIKNAQILQIF